MHDLVLSCNFNGTLAWRFCLFIPGNLISIFFSFDRSTPSEEVSVGDASEGPQLLEERLTKEEWQAINKLLSYQPEDELASLSGKEAQNMIQFLVTVSVRCAAARIISINQTEIICGRFEQLEVSTKFKHRSTYCDVVLRFYGLSAPEGSLAEVCLFCLWFWVVLSTRIGSMTSIKRSIIVMRIVQLNPDFLSLSIR